MGGSARKGNRKKSNRPPAQKAAVGKKLGKRSRAPPWLTLGRRRDHQGPQHCKGPEATTEAKLGSGDGAHGRPSDEDAEAFALNVARAETGEDARTTVMVKNIPNKYTQRNLLDLIDGNYAGKYDFFYLPIDFKNKCNLGYAFINFRNPTSIGCCPTRPRATPRSHQSIPCTVLCLCTVGLVLWFQTG